MADNNTSPSNEQLVHIFNKQYESFAQDIGQCNILLVGKTGVGKSSLLNAVFTKKLAETGTGKPITQYIKQYIQPDCPITVYDSPGLELSGEVIQRLKKDVAALIADKRKLPIENHIHFVWFCINNQSSRLENAEEEWIKELAEQKVPVIIVLTQTLNAKHSELLDFIKGLNLPIHDVIPVLAEPLKITNDYTIQSHGLGHLVEVTASILPKVASKAFIAEQKVNVDLKISEAEKCIKFYAGGAGLAGSPLSNVFGGFLVAGVQMSMIIHLTYLCGLQFNRAFLLPIYTACAAVSIPVLIALSIPGLDLVEAPVGAAMTYFMGQAVLFGYKQYLNQKIGKDEIAKTIIDEYKQVWDRYKQKLPNTKK
ncbi:MAG: GTPase [Nostoc sp. EfeVER01]|uniref:GTPase domain-containing protein n=1 Tax=unclassified Nostoc TaxID=2593658 RepID=UPI002AD1D608|nr:MULTISPECIES: GTPase domain-containing protein [unclassified Nostoc]MDZ7948426.1 GTPase domain-containing protein [Nostoc sp. EfeVER01]MDZ7995775.1 GTPase domain-containing protein [Nostoc sp. EspVER01]